MQHVSFIVDKKGFCGRCNEHHTAIHKTRLLLISREILAVDRLQDRAVQSRLHGQGTGAFSARTQSFAAPRAQQELKSFPFSGSFNLGPALRLGGERGQLRSACKTDKYHETVNDSSGHDGAPWVVITSRPLWQ